MIRWHKHVLFLLAQLVLDDSNSDSDSGDSNSDSGGSDSGDSSDSAASSFDASDSGDSASNNNSIPRSSREASQTSSPSSVGAGVQDIANLQNVTDTQLGDIPPRDVGIGPLDQPQLPLDDTNPPNFTENGWPDPNKNSETQNR